MKSFSILEINEVVKGILTGNTSHRITGAEQIKLTRETHITFIGNKKFGFGNGPGAGTIYPGAACF